MISLKPDNVYSLILAAWILFDAVLLLTSIYTAQNKLLLIHGTIEEVGVVDTRKSGKILAKIRVGADKFISVEESFWANFRWWLKKKPKINDYIYVYVEAPSLSEGENQAIKGFGFSRSENYPSALLWLDYYGSRQRRWSLFIYPIIFLLLIGLKQLFQLNGVSPDLAHHFLIFYGCCRSLIILLFL